VETLTTMINGMITTINDPNWDPNG
jgi:hypothetical protein